MSPSLSPETGHVVSKSGLGAVALGELVPLTVFVPSARAFSAAEVKMMVHKNPIIIVGFFIAGLLTRNALTVNSSPFNKSYGFALSEFGLISPQ